MARKDQLARASYRPDRNVDSYHSDRDGRNWAGEAVRWVLLANVHSSRHQTRLVRNEASERLLADDIAETGLIQAPVVRADPLRDGEYEVVVGHRRMAALRVLAKEGRGEGTLRFQGGRETEPMVPVMVRDVDDLTAQAQTVSENLHREDLSAWEQAVALHRLKSALSDAGERGSVRGVAAHLDASHQTIAPYLQIIPSIRPEVIQAAGIKPGTREADEALCALSLNALLRVARKSEAPEKGCALRAELEKAGVVDGGAGERDREATDPGGSTSEADGPEEDIAGRPFSLTIRKPIRELDPDQARRYLDRLKPVVEALTQQAMRVGPGASAR